MVSRRTHVRSGHMFWEAAALWCSAARRSTSSTLRVTPTSVTGSSGFSAWPTVLWTPPRGQTRFVLARTLALGLRPIVVVNRIDEAGPACLRGPGGDVRPLLGSWRKRRATRFPDSLCPGNTGLGPTAPDWPAQDMDALSSSWKMYPHLESTNHASFACSPRHSRRIPISGGSCR